MFPIFRPTAKVRELKKHIIKGVYVGNVTQVTSTNPWLQNQTFSETFTYDASDQLIAADNPLCYQLAVGYDDWGKIGSYNITHMDMLNNTSESHAVQYSYIAGKNGISWLLARIAFDIYQGGIEPDVTKSAEKLGHSAGIFQYYLNQPIQWK